MVLGFLGFDVFDRLKAWDSFSYINHRFGLKRGFGSNSTVGRQNNSNCFVGGSTAFGAEIFGFRQHGEPESFSNKMVVGGDFKWTTTPGFLNAAGTGEPPGPDGVLLQLIDSTAVFPTSPMGVGQVTVGVNRDGSLWVGVGGDVYSEWAFMHNWMKQLPPPPELPIIFTGGFAIGQTAPVLLDAQRWYNVELSATIHGSHGTVQIRVDSELVFDYFGVTDFSGSGYADVGAVGCAGFNAKSIDNFYVLDGKESYFNDSLAKLGAPQYRVTSHVAVNAGRFSEWLPDPATNFQKMHNWPSDPTVKGPSGQYPGYNSGNTSPNDSQFIYATGSGLLTDTYRVTPFDVRSFEDSPDAIQLTYRVRNMGTGTPVIRAAVQSQTLEGDGFYLGEPITVTSTPVDDVDTDGWFHYRDYSFVLADPSTGKLWTKESLNKTQFGIQHVSGDLQCSVMVVERLCRGLDTGGPVSYAKMGKAKFGVSVG